MNPDPEAVRKLVESATSLQVAAHAIRTCEGGLSSLATAMVILQDTVAIVTLIDCYICHNWRRRKGSAFIFTYMSMEPDPYLTEGLTIH
jgi:hypothetical protein